MTTTQSITRAIATFVVAGIATFIGQTQARPCTTLTWRVDTLATPSGQRVYTERPVIVRTTDGLVLLGSPTVALDSTGFPAPVRNPTGSAASAPPSIIAAGAIVGPQTAFIALPSGSRGLVDPRAVARGDTVHVAWVEPDSGSPPSAGVPKRTTIWYARWHRGTWSPRESVAELADPQWNRLHLIEMMMVGDALHLIVPLEGLIEAAAYIRRENSRWTVSTFAPGRIMIAYVRARIERTGGITLAFISSGAGDERAWNHVYVARSADGIAWSAPEDISRPWTGPAYDLETASSGDTMYLAWIERPLRPASNPDLADSVRLLWQRRGDPAWSRAPALAVAHNSNGLQIAAGPRGTIHVVLREGSPDSPLITATWSAGRWNASRPSLPPAAAQPSLAAVGPDSLLMVWGIARTSAFGPSPQSVMAIANLSCAARM